MAGGVQIEEPRFCPGVSCCCTLRHGVLVSTSVSFVVWLLISFFFWPGIVYTTSETGRFNRTGLVVGQNGADVYLPVEDDEGHCVNSVSRETVTTWTLVVPPIISFPGLIVDIIALIRLGACAKRTCPVGVAGCVNDRLARGPLLLPKLVFHGCLVAFIAVVLVLTNVYFCPESALLINVVAPLVIAFYVFHSVQVYRLRKFKIEFMKNVPDDVDASQEHDPTVVKLINMTRRGVLSKADSRNNAA